MSKKERKKNKEMKLLGRWIWYWRVLFGLVRYRDEYGSLHRHLSGCSYGISALVSLCPIQTEVGV